MPEHRGRSASSHTTRRGVHATRPGADGDRFPRLGISIFVFAGCLALAILPLLPQAAPDDPAPGEFSAERALRHVTQLANEPRPIGAPANTRAREYIISQIGTMSLAAELQSIVVPNYYSPEAGTVTITNVMARIPGEDSTGAIAMVGHYDTVPTTPGANDDAAAVATILETARALLAAQPLRNDVILLLTDGEEPAPRYGSEGFLAGHSWSSAIGFVLNLEAAGGSGRSVLVETGGTGDGAAAAYVAASSHPAAYSYLPEILDLIGGVGSDFDPFKDSGVPGLHFVYAHSSPIYHTGNDTVESVSLSSLQHHGLNTLETVRHVGALDLGRDLYRSDSVYFTVLASQVIWYPASWALPLALLAALIIGAALVRRSRTRTAAFRVLLGSSAVALLVVHVVALAATLGWQLITLARPEPETTETYFYLTALVALSAATAAGLARGFHTRLSQLDLPGGIILIWLFLALISALWLPGTSYIFVWPALACGIVWLWQPVRPWARIVAIAVVSLVTLTVVVVPIDTVFQMAQPRPGNLDSQVTSAVVVPMLLALLSLGLIVNAASGRAATRRRTPGPA